MAAQEPPGRLPAAMYVDHVEQRGEELFRQVCEIDSEGIVCKPAESSYGRGRWVKIKNPGRQPGDWSAGVVQQAAVTIILPILGRPRNCPCPFFLASCHRVQRSI